MRHPSLAKKEGDLSRLTTSSSSSSQENSGIYLPESEIITSTFTSTYLPEVIDPIEWQTSRKRKERQDSTSSITQDKKLVRSNSEEYIPNVDYEVIRRVVSHEEFKHPLQDKTNGNVTTGIIGEQQQLCADRKSTNNNNGTEVQEILRETHKRTETSPARSRTFDYSHKHRISPHRDAVTRHTSNGRAGGTSSGNNGDYDADGEHERRRSSERFCKARAAPGRKAQSSKKSSKHLAAKLRERDENVYKYDITLLKCERRGFVSSKQETKPVDDKYVIKYEDNSKESTSNQHSHRHQHHLHQQLPDSTTQHNNDNNNFIDIQQHANRSPKSKSRREMLPWDRSYQDDAPVVCTRFADSTFDHVAHSHSKTGDTGDSDIARNQASGLKSLGTFLTTENMKTRELMKNAPTAVVYSTPDERLKQINKRLVALKKRVASFEEVFERENGYRPSQSEKLNDKFMKYAIAEIHKLRKEKQQLKSDPVAAMGLSTPPQQGGNKVQKMKETLVEIEKRLQEKRMGEKRSESLDDLSPDQLVQEKTAIQRGLLYLESLFGRPNTKDERDAARSLYDRYRAIKRSLNRASSLTTGLAGVSELPTILEHEAMQFTANTTVSTTGDVTSSSMTTSFPSSIESPSETSMSILSTDSSDTSSSVQENVHTLSIEELWKQLEIARDEKKELRRSIKEFEEIFEERNGRKMLKTDRTLIEDTYLLYKQKKAKLRLLDALVKKHIAK